MGYMHIENLYKDQSLLMFKRVYALEKIHGTSAAVAYKAGEINLEHGAVPHESFASVFNLEGLTRAFQSLGHDDVVVYGEAYGGAIKRKTAKTYGPELRFIVFDVQIGGVWLNVPNATDVTSKLGLEFVAYEEVDATVACLDFERDRSSRQAQRNGMGDGLHAEGIVIRPLIELTKNNGKRLIAKHKRAEFSERTSKADTRVVDPAQRIIVTDAEKCALEWVTDMRLTHVLDKLGATLGRALEMKDTPAVLAAMQEDVYREGQNEMVRTKATDHCINTRTREMFHARIQQIQEM